MCVYEHMLGCFVHIINTFAGDWVDLWAVDTYKIEK